MATDTPTKVVTGKVRLSYVNLVNPTTHNDNPTPKYGCTILVPKSDTKTVNAIKRAQKAALEEGKSKKFDGKIPAKWNNSFRDADSDEEADTLEKNPEYEGHYFMSVSNTRKPGIVDRDRDPIDDPSEIYSGMYARVSLNAFAYNTNGNKGVSFGLQNVQKLKDGTPLGNISRAEDDFGDDFADSDDDGDDLL